MRLTAVLTGSLLVMAGLARAQSECESARARAEAMESALRECLRGGGSCGPEFERRDAARTVAASCQETAPMRTTAAEMPRTAVATSGSSLAILVEGAASIAERDAVLASTRDAIIERRVIDPGTVRAAREFSGVATLGTVGAEGLRKDLEADQLLVIEIRAEGDARFVAFRVFGVPAPPPRFAESSAAGLPADASRIAAELFPKPKPEPMPVPVAIATPPPDPTPSSTPAAVAPTPTPVPPARPTAWSSVAFDVDAVGGNKRLDADQWAPLSSQAELGLAATASGRDSMVGLTVNGSYSFASGTAKGIPISTRTTQAGIGPRVEFAGLSRWVKPWAETGPALFRVTNRAEFPAGTQTFSATGFGLWAGAGADVPVGPAHATLSLRYSFGTVADGGERIDAGGVHAGLGVGMTFGKRR